MKQNEVLDIAVTLVLNSGAMHQAKELFHRPPAQPPVVANNQIYHMLAASHYSHITLLYPLNNQQ
ncbi:hypothetical protein [Sinobacterium caligoides]|uniref:hypothetical protein n=1 Tax=Sinobacterium caligoides TaxID=933926 RepID=UPI0011CE1E87|nr:hypothetical protein [Sinobacterium caligoides]